MTGTGTTLVARTSGTDYSGVNAHIGNLEVDGTVTIGSNLVVRGRVTINSGRTLTATTQHIWVENFDQTTPIAYADPATWDQQGIFYYHTSTVEFGHAASPPGVYYYLKGDTTWYNLECHVDSATMLFSNYAGGPVPPPMGTYGHRVYGKLSINPVTESVPTMIKINRAQYVSPPDPYPTMPVSDAHIPPALVNQYFWSFYLHPSATLDVNYVRIDYSYSQRKIPVPKAGSALALSWVVSAWPYVYFDGTLTPPYNPGHGDSHFNVDWFTMNNFFYGFTEDSDHNGRIDRIRLQAALDVMNGPAAFADFEVEVTGYEVDHSKFYNGYRRVQVDETDPATGDTDLDSIYVYLVEKPSSDTGASLHWRILRNTTLKDLATQRSIIGNPAGGEGPADEGDATDTAPPRINYAFALPERKEIFFQMSEPITIAGLGLSNVADNLSASLDLLPTGVERTEFLIRLNDTAYDLAGLASGTKTFRLFNVFDSAERAHDLKADTSIPYNDMYPGPKYPQNYDYDYKSGGFGVYNFQPYLENPGNTAGISITLPTEMVLDNHLVSDMLISVPPSKATDTQYFIWPLWAKYTQLYSSADDDKVGLVPSPGYGYMNPENPFNDSVIIWDFTGKRFLERDNITMQGRLNNALTGTPDITYAFNVSEFYKSSSVHGSPNLWQLDMWQDPPWPSPPVRPDYYLAPRFFGITPKPLTPVSSRLFNYNFLVAEYPGNVTVEFFYRLNGLFAARLDIAPDEAIPPDWYRRVRPFSFGIHDITRQRGGVTILNNVINSTKRENVFLDFKLDTPGRVTIQVFTLDGNLVKVLYRGNLPAQEKYYRYAWDGTNNGGRPVARGMYFIRIVAPDIDEIRKVMVIK
jgi:hypothetical protein